MAKNKITHELFGECVTLKYHIDKETHTMHEGETETFTRLILKGSQRQPTLYEAQEYIRSHASDFDYRFTRGHWVVVLRQLDEWVPEEDMMELELTWMEDSEHCPVCYEQFEKDERRYSYCGREWD